MATTTSSPPARQTCRLHPFPGSGDTPVRSLTVELAWTVNRELALTYQLEGDHGRIALPPQAAGFADGLWQHTCFEAFFAGSTAPAYREFNFSPSGQWAAYAFTAYREGGEPMPAPLPRMAVSRFPDCLELRTVLAAAALPAADDAAWRVGLSAVVESIDGHCSYWALAHPAERPDFHHRDAFILELSHLPNPP
ncbi:MAG: DOMON-like domain-containing protein [Betaproteobacteria bacterium]